MGAGALLEAVFEQASVLLTVESDILKNRG